jgi:hypothetical protein
MAVEEEVTDYGDARMSYQITKGFMKVKFLSLTDELVTSEEEVPVIVESF